ncbi:hypothetical protein EOM39_03540 [Candidatus Gracilibacteria bacterium]|nr:hypothetical protein [Candidatus Gracilibacteria bacterium]
MQKNTQASILIYILVLISIVMIMAVVVLNNSIMLENSLTYQEIRSKLSNKIKEKGNMFADYDLKINSDGGGFSDIISCPDKFIMSGATVYSDLTETDRSYSGTTSKVCSGTYNSYMINIIPNSTNTGFTSATWWGVTTTLTNNNGDLTGLFFGKDASGAILGTDIIIYSGAYNKPDGIDDDFNSDNWNGD